jgi:hypothetical protein
MSFQDMLSVIRSYDPDITEPYDYRAQYKIIEILKDSQQKHICRRREAEI